MGSFTTDFFEIENAIKDGITTPESVRILTSEHSLTLDNISSYPNLEEIRTPIVINDDEFHLVIERVKELKKLSLISIEIYTTDSSDNSHKNKHRKKKRKTTPRFPDFISSDLPSQLDELGKRLGFLNLDVSFTSGEEFFSFSSRKGHLSINSPIPAKELVKVFNENGCLESITWDASFDYDVEEIDTVAIVISDQTDFHIIADMVEKTNNIIIYYNKNTFYLYSEVSQIILDCTLGTLENIRAIVPLSHVQKHIDINEELKEIYLFISDREDIEFFKELIEENEERFLTYVIFHDGLEGINELKSLGDVDIYDIVKHLNGI